MPSTDIRSYPWFFAGASWVANRLPARVVFPPTYFRIRDLLSVSERGADVSNALLDRLCEVLRTAVETVPYYRSLGLGLKANDITPTNALTVLRSFPYLDKKCVQNDSQAFLSNRFNAKRLLMGTSSGSTGNGVRIYSTYNLSLSLLAFFHHEWAKCGYGRAVRVARFGCDGIRNENDSPFTWTPDKLYVSPYHFNDAWIEQIAAQVRSSRSQFIHGYPSCVAHLAEYLIASGQSMPQIRGVLLASETVHDRQLNLIDKAFPEARMSINYGLSERTNLAWGFRDASGLHYRTDSVFGHTEEFAHADGNRELVGTSYWNTVMPLIRYRTQDYGVLRDGIITRLDGREQEFFITRQGGRIAGFTVEIADFAWEYVKAIQLVQDAPGKLQYHAQVRPNYRREIGELILADQEKKWGGYFEMSLRVEPALQDRTASGKQRMIINNLNRLSATPVIAE